MTRLFLVDNVATKTIVKPGTLSNQKKFIVIRWQLQTATGDAATVLANERTQILSKPGATHIQNWWRRARPTTTGGDTCADFLAVNVTLPQRSEFLTGAWKESRKLDLNSNKRVLIVKALVILGQNVSVHLTNVTHVVTLRKGTTLVYCLSMVTPRIAEHGQSGTYQRNGEDDISLCLVC